MEVPQPLAEVSGAEDIIPSPPAKKPKIDDEFADPESDEESGDEFVATESDEELGFRPVTSEVFDMKTDSESDDDYSSPPPEDYEKYCRELEESQGYDIKTHVVFSGSIRPLDPIPPHDVDYLIECCRHAMEQYNRDKGTNFHFLEIDKVNVAMDCTACSYITFRAKDGQNAAETLTFQTKVYPMTAGQKIEEVRLKP